MGKAIKCVASAVLVAAGVGLLATGERLTDASQGYSYVQTAVSPAKLGDSPRP